MLGASVPTLVVVIATLELARASVLEATPSWDGMVHEGREWGC